MTLSSRSFTAFLTATVLEVSIVHSGKGETTSLTTPLAIATQVRTLCNLSYARCNMDGTYVHKSFMCFQSLFPCYITYAGGNGEAQREQKKTSIDHHKRSGS